MSKKTKQIVVLSVLGTLALVAILVNAGVFSGETAVAPEVGQAAVQQVEQIQKAMPPEPPTVVQPNAAPINTRGSGAR
ncbi:MAG: hypothetical protein K2Q20_11665 [Phycisphaerales bacterium]|nr:hypothetical protein [Phycisphaerales bacterium]